MKTRGRFAALLIVALLCTGCTLGGSSAPAQPEIPEFTVPADVLGEPSDLVPELKLDKYPLPESEGLSLVRQMKLGWNLGNTFDAVDLNISAENELDYEKGWCGSITTIDNLAAIKAAGFETIRIPVSWHNHVDENNRISEQWIQRVKEVVSWARAVDLYVIINTHHDNSEQFYFPDSAHMEQSKAFLGAVWKQIAETFRDFDDHVILESLNEPRLVGTDHEWWLDRNSPECMEAVDNINTLNQLFVDTVRGTGGGNETRWLLVPGYCASADGAMNEKFTVPNDSAGHMIVSVHAYTPYNFALNKQGTDQWSLDVPGDMSEITNFMDNLYGKFTSKGIPVLIGECGAMNKENLEARVQWAAFYTAAARVRGITCCLWDNNAFTGSGENFGLLSRSDNTFRYPEIIQALVKGSEYT